jgi:hypothetical protein
MKTGLLVHEEGPCNFIPVCLNPRRNPARNRITVNCSLELVESCLRLRKLFFRMGKQLDRHSNNS